MGEKGGSRRFGRTSTMPSSAAREAAAAAISAACALTVPPLASRAACERHASTTPRAHHALLAARTVALPAALSRRAAFGGVRARFLPHLHHVLEALLQGGQPHFKCGQG